MYAYVYLRASHLERKHFMVLVYETNERKQLKYYIYVYLRAVL